MTVTRHGAAAGVAVDLDATLAHLDAVVRELGTPPADRDAVLWAAHELAACARLLVRSRDDDDRADGRVQGQDDADGDLGPALACARSAMASLTIARRQDTRTTDGWPTARS